MNRRSFLCSAATLGAALPLASRLVAQAPAAGTADIRNGDASTVSALVEKRIADAGSGRIDAPRGGRIGSGRGPALSVPEALPRPKATSRVAS